MTDQDLALRLLNRNCYDLDPQRPFLPTSPVDGMGHGHYVFRSAEGEEVFQLFAQANCTAYTEFGCGGPAPAALLREIIPPADLFPPRLGTAWETHHALGAWEPNSHLLYDVLERYFGPCENLDQLVERGQLLQAEGLKCLFEEARRQKPRAAMALNWCFNEPWPCAANMSVLAWPAVPKAAYHAVARSLRPVLASAKLARFQWKEDDEFAPELWLLNDSPEPLPAGRVEAFLRLGGTEHRLLAWDHPALAPNRNLPGPVIRFALPAGAGPRMALVLRCADHPERDSDYVLLYQPAPAAARDGTRPLNQ
jgi:beta-mannosidase